MRRSKLDNTKRRTSARLCAVVTLGVITLTSATAGSNLSDQDLSAQLFSIVIQLSHLFSCISGIQKMLKL